MNYRQIIQEQIEHLQVMQKMTLTSTTFDAESACKIAKKLLLLCKELTNVPSSK